MCGSSKKNNKQYRTKDAANNPSSDDWVLGEAQVESCVTDVRTDKLESHLLQSGECYLILTHLKSSPGKRIMFSKHGHLNIETQTLTMQYPN